MYKRQEKKETSEAFEAWDEAEDAVEKAVEETAEKMCIRDRNESNCKNP